ncbi:MAG: T9SS type A sorting domain-containing protein [Cyclonatronaceae bacterium]
MHFADPQNGLVIGGSNGIYIYITSDGGETWSRKEPEGSYEYRSGYMISPDRLVLTTYQQLKYFAEGILVTSVDGGDSWNMEWTGAYVTNSIGFESSEIGYVFFNYARYRTQDGGKNWTKQLIGSDEFAGIVHPPGAFYADGVWFFRDNAGYVSKNENVETGLATFIRSPDFSRFNYITRHTTGLYLLSNNRIYRSQDEGNTLSPVFSSAVNEDSRNRIHFVGENAGFGVFLRDQIRTQSAGDNWEVVTAFIQHEARAFHFSDLIYIDQQTAYAVGADGGLYKREPMFGWYQLQPPAGNVYRVITADGNRVWAGGDEGNLIYSTDDGMNWEQLELPVNADIREIYRPFGEQIWLLTNVPGLIIKSEDGIHFTMVETGYNVVINSLLIEDQLTMTAVGDQSHILTSTDGGETWMRENAVTDKYPSRYDLLSVVRLANGGMKAVGTNGAILHRSADLTSIEPGMDKPDRVSLYQNYPNPFNPKTTIFYTLNQPGAVRIDVYNSIGQLVIAFDKGMQNQGGHRFEFNGSGLPSGLYLYRLSVNGQLAGTKKMLLIK